VCGDVNACFCAVSPQNILNAGHGNAVAVSRNENRPIFCDRAAREPALERILRGTREIDNPLPASFAVYQNTWWFI
jgi:hypothetical protein